MGQPNRMKYYLLVAAAATLGAIIIWTQETPHATHEHDHEHEDEHEEFVALTPEQREAANIQTAPVRSGFLRDTIRTNGKIVLNGNKVAHVVPKVSGVVKEILKTTGDDVDVGETLLILESREIAEAKAAYLGALKNGKAALEILSMEEGLKQKNMTSTQDYQTALKEAGAAETELELARQKLQALGLKEEEIASLGASDNNQLRYFEVKSPLAGTILNKHAVLGERLSGESDAYTIADLDQLWVEVFLYPSDLPKVKKGNPIHLQTLDDKEGLAWITYVHPVIDEETRMSMAIAELDNNARGWAPGSYTSIEIETNKQPVALVIDKEALQTIEGENCVFVEAENGFEIRPVQTGRCDGKKVEILSGVSKGEKIASTNTFLLKADHLKNEAEHEH